MRSIANVFLCFVFVFFLNSCNKNNNNQNQSVSVEETSLDIKSIYPSDEVISEKYQRSCYICHVNESAMAPLVGSEKWQELISNKGMEELVNNVTNGYKNMPARGQCLDCSKEDYIKLIEFMANPSSK